MHAGRVDFLHPLLRAAVYHVADAVERRGAHRALAKVLDQSQQDRVAWHLAAAATGPDEEVARYLEETAVTAQGRRGYATAANALATAARLSPGTNDRIRRTMGAANAFRLGGQAQTAADLLAGVLDLTTDPLLRAEMQQLRGSALMSTGPMMEVFAMLVEEADRVDAHDPARATTLLTIASMGAVGAAEVAVAVETARRAVRTSGIH